MHFFHRCTSFFMPSEKNIFVWALSHACTASFRSWSEVNRRPPQCLLNWTKQVIVWKGEIGTTQRVSQCLKLEFLKGFKCVGSSMWTGIVMQQHNTFWQLSSAFSSNFRLLPVNKHLTVTSTVYCWTPFLIMFQYWALWVPKNCKHQFFCWWLAFELFPDGQLWMFPFHNLAFTLCLIMVDPCFSPVMILSKMASPSLS